MPFPMSYNILVLCQLIMVKNSVTVMSMNVNGIRDYAKRKGVISWLVYDSNMSPDIIFLQETH